MRSESGLKSHIADVLRERGRSDTEVEGGGCGETRREAGRAESWAAGSWPRAPSLQNLEGVALRRLSSLTVTPCHSGPSKLTQTHPTSGMSFSMHLLAHMCNVSFLNYGTLQVGTA